MQYRPLGTTGVQVSALCLGTMSFGGDADDKTAAELFGAARDAGVNFFDCADVYSKGKAEQVLGKLAVADRDELILTSKAHFPVGRDANARGLSRRHLVRAVEASLQRLGTDRIDLYFAHGFDDRTPIEETVRAMDDLVRDGKVLYLGASNWAAWQVATALGIARNEARSRFQVIQPMYNLVKRQAEVELLPLAAAEGLGVMTYSPLGGGLLSGKYGVDKSPARGRLRDNKMYKMRYNVDGYFETADQFTAHASERDMHPATLAVAWAISHPAVTSALIGGRDVEQLTPSLAAGDLALDPDERHTISTFSPEPPLPTDRLEERRGYVYVSGDKR